MAGESERSRTEWRIGVLAVTSFSALDCKRETPKGETPIEVVADTDHRLRLVRAEPRPSQSVCPLGSLPAWQFAWLVERLAATNGLGRDVGQCFPVAVVLNPKSVPLRARRV